MCNAADTDVRSVRSYTMALSFVTQSIALIVLYNIYNMVASLVDVIVPNPASNMYPFTISIDALSPTRILCIDYTVQHISVCDPHIA
jgi:hypothetical protein